MSARPLALIVEDSDDQTALLRRHLTREGYDAFTASDAESAIAAFDGIDPAIAVVDLILPGMSGQECARRIRERFPHCFIIISSVLNPEDYPPADAALPKPITGARLHDALGRISA